MKCLSLLFSGLFILAMPEIAQSQSESIVVKEIPVAKKYDQFIGVQANLLIQQVFNFGESSENTNPYLIKYTIRQNATGWALNAGMGVSSTTSENDEGFKRTNDGFDARVGLGYQKTIGKNFEVGVGFDFIYGYQAIETFSVQVVSGQFQVDSSLTTSSDKAMKYGGGLQANMAYVFGKRFTVGTEMSLYYAATTEKFNVTSESHQFQPGFPGTVNLSSSNEKSDGREFRFQVPIAIFVSFKF